MRLFSECFKHYSAVVRSMDTYSESKSHNVKIASMTLLYILKKNV